MTPSEHNAERRISRLAGRAAISLAVLAGSLTTGCPKKGPLIAEATPLDAWHSFTDTDKHTALVATSTHIWAGTDRGLIRWELLTGDHTTFTVDDGLASQPVRAVALERGRTVWVAGDHGVSRIESDRIVNMVGAEFPAKGKVRAMTVTEVADEALHAWLATDVGLYRYAYGAWNLFATEFDVLDVASGTSGEVWLATASRGIVRLRAASTTMVGAEEGLPSMTVRELAVEVGDQAVALCAVAPKAPATMMAVYDGRTWRGLAPPGGGSFDLLASSPDRTIVRLSGTFYELETLRKASDATIPAGDTSRIRIDIVTGKTATDSPSPFGFELKKVTEPPDRALASATTIDPSGNLWIGTHNLGIASVPPSGDPVTWLRTKDVLTGGRVLSIATDDAGRVILPGRGNRVMVYDGASWSEMTVDADPAIVVDAVVNDPGGRVWALVRPKGTNVIKFLRMSGADTWETVGDVTIEVPRGVVEVGYVASTPSGHFWISVSYRDGSESLPFGMAVVPSSLEGAVHYYRHDRKTDYDPSLDLPVNDIAGVTFDSGGAWLATFSGVFRMSHSGNTLYTENEGLESDITYDVVRTSTGEIWAGTNAGAGYLKGERWVFDTKRGALLGRAVKALAVDHRGTMWGGTSMGLFRKDRDDTWQKLGPDVAGLLDASVLDIAVDRNGRVWFLTSSGISVYESK